MAVLTAPLQDRENVLRKCHVTERRFCRDRTCRGDDAHTDARKDPARVPPHATRVLPSHHPPPSADVLGERLSTVVTHRRRRAGVPRCAKTRRDPTAWNDGPSNRRLKAASYQASVQRAAHTSRITEKLPDVCRACGIRGGIRSANRGEQLGSRSG